MHNLRLSAALAGVAVVSMLATIAAFTTTSSRAAADVGRPPIEHAAKRPADAAQRLAVAPLHRVTKKKTSRRRHTTTGLPGARPIGASPSLYERTTSVAILRAQGCAAGRARENGLIVLDFGKLAYRSRRGGYGTVTFANRFAPNRAITWAMKSYARGYSECLPHASHSKIVLARGTSNYGQGEVPSTYTAGRLWAGATVAFANYLKRHHMDRVTAAAGDDAEPAWDRGFTMTYDFFRGYEHSDHGYLLYNYGSLDGGVGSIWKLRQAYYVSGGMHLARAVPEIYNHSMAQQWAELARQSLARYRKPIRLAGVMTQHWTSCHGCGYTAPKARHELVHALRKANVMALTVPTRTLATVTNIGSAPSVDISE